MAHQTSSTPQEPQPLALDHRIPIACVPSVFTEAERAAHLDASMDALVRWPLRRQELTDGYLFEYEGTEERFVALARWAAGEHRCCPWAACSLEMAPFSAGQMGAIRVRFRAIAEGMAFMRTCYDYVAKLDSSRPPDTLFKAERIVHDDVRRELARCSDC